MTVTRGTTNGNARGSSYSRARRRAWLVETYQADTNLLVIHWTDGTSTGQEPSVLSVSALMAYPQVASVDEVASCRCYRCGRLLTVETVTVDRIIPGCQGGTYRRNNIRPACGPCNSETGGGVRR